MKKLITMVLVLSMLISCFAALPAQAKVGDVVGTAWHTDIVTYINHYAVPTYVVNDRVVVIAEDLRNFGFNVTWNGVSRTLDIARNYYNNNVSMMNVTKDGQPSTKYRDVLETDIRVYANGAQITSYNINGMTMIPLEELTMFGTFVWLGDQRALKMWVEDGLSMNSTMQYVAPYGQAPTPTPTPSYPSTPGAISYYPGTYIPTYESVTGVGLLQPGSLNDEGTVMTYVYPFTDADTVGRYWDSLETYGWTLYDQKSEDGLYSTYHIHNTQNQMIGVTVAVEYDQVWIMYTVEGQQQPTTSKYYPGTNIPTYESITGVSQIRSPYSSRTSSGGTGYTYYYSYDHDRMETTFTKYLNALVYDYGWEVYDYETDYSTYEVNAYFTKGGEMFLVTVAIIDEEVKITFIID